MKKLLRRLAFWLTWHVSDSASMSYSYLGEEYIDVPEHLKGNLVKIWKFTIANDRSTVNWLKEEI